MGRSGGKLPSREAGKQEMELARQTLTVLLIEDNPDYAKIVQHWLSQPSAEVEYVLNWTDSLAESRRRLASGNVSVILLDLNLPDSEGASTFTAVHSQVPEIPVIILSAGDDVAMALQLIQEGADNYLVKSSCSAEVLTRAIRYAVVKHGSNTGRQRTEEPLDKATVVAVIGGKGGVGATTVACTLASELRRRTGEAVLLADFDMHTGLVAFLMAVESEYSIMDAVSNSDRLDRSLWQRIVVQSEEGVDVVCSPSMAGSIDALPERLCHVLATIRPFYRWIVLDLGHVNSYAPRILEAAGELVVITTTGIPALYETRRAIETLRNAGMGDRIRLTVNRMEPLEGCPQKDLRSIFGIEVSTVLPSSSRELHEACVQKKMPGRNSAFSKEMGKLVQAIGGPQELELRKPTLAERLHLNRKSPSQPAVK
jgi:Flp pilus assembly CpaE family ATPase